MLRNAGRVAAGATEVETLDSVVEQLRLQLIYDARVFHSLSKVLDLAVAPLAWAIVLVVVAVVLSQRRPRASRLAGVLAVAVLAAFSSPLTANLLLRSTERHAPLSYDPLARYDAVVVLTGMLHLGATNITGRAQFNDAADRLIAAFRVYRTGHATNIFISGEHEAEPLRRQLIEWGVPADRILFEDVSRNTHENAVRTREAVQQHGWRRLLLVTSAFHMPRALACFRHEGLSPDTLPADYRAGDGADDGILPREHFLANSALALRELCGRIVYRIVGYTE